jgi:hypothetical protein
MATSPNYGWLEPDNTDLVKNGALAIRTLGNAIDTTMATMTPKSTYTAKGSIAAATGASTPANLAVGPDGSTIVADSSASTGLRYQVGNGLAQGVINGGFDIWQRSTSTSGNGYTCTDRFYVYGSGTSTFSRESSVVPTGLQYSFKHLAGATTSSSLAQVIETSNAILYAGQTVTLSMYASASTATTMSLQLAYSTGTDTGIGGSWTDITATGSATFAAGTGGAFTRGSAIFAVPSTAKSLRVTLAVSGNIANTVAVYYAGAQLEVGSVATQFRRAGGTIQGELAACMRYFYVIASGDQQSITNGFYSSSTDCRGNLRYPVQMRVTPTFTSSTGTDQFAFETSAGVDGLNRLDGARVSNTSLLIYNNTTASGTAGNAGELRTNSASALFTVSAEL